MLADVRPKCCRTLPWNNDATRRGGQLMGCLLVLQHLMCGPCQLRQAMSGKSGRRSPRSQREMYRKIHACALELLAKLGHSYVISALSREPLFSISEDREVVCKEGAFLDSSARPERCS